MHEETEKIIEEFLGGHPRADDLGEMIAALAARRDTFLREREAATNEAQQKEWDARLREVEKQIQVLQEERAITGFVEDTIRVTVNRPRYDLDDEDLE